MLVHSILCMFTPLPSVSHMLWHPPRIKDADFFYVQVVPESFW